MNNHQQKQREVISKIEKDVQNDTGNFSVVAPVEDYEKDPRICLTCVNFPHGSLIASVEQIINSLKEVEPSYFYYPTRSLHMTVKSIRVINDPPHFNDNDVKIAEKVFSEVIPQHKSYQVYFYRLLLFNNNLALIGTTDPEFDGIILELDKKLKEAGLPDDKIYSNSKYFFCNMTLSRFPQASEKFKEKVSDISNRIQIKPYTVNSVSLVSSNAVFTNLKKINTWNLQTS